MIYPYHHWESGILPKPRGVVSPEEWEQDPDSGIQALIDRYHAENPSITLRSTNTNRIPARSHPARSHPARKKKKPTSDAPKAKPAKPRRRYGYQDSIFNKECRCCGKVLPRERFSRNAKSPDGYLARCKTCRAAYDRQRRQALKQAGRIHDGHKL